MEGMEIGRRAINIRKYLHIYTYNKPLDMINPRFVMVGVMSSPTTTDYRYIYKINYDI